MKEDLKTLLSWSDDYILSSNETNMYLNSEHELFNEVCEEIIEIACKPQQLRSVKVTLSDGDSFTSSMAAHLTDQDIKNYYRIGSEFNLGTEEDRMVEVVKVEILS